MAINLNGTGSITGLSSISSPTISGGNFPAGTAGSPGITLSGDADTGLYSPGANQIAIATSGVAALTIDASQRVGLGTSSPQQLLHIHNSAAADARLKISNGTTGSAQYDGFELNTGSTGLAGIIQWEQQPIYFYTNNGTAVDPRLVITAAGNVGVGSSSPQGRFESVAGDSTDYAIVANNSLSTGGEQNYISLNAGTTRIGSVNRTSNDIAVKANYGSVSFWTGTGGTATQKAAIDSSGRLLVGTSSAFTASTGNAPYGKFATIGATNDATAQGIIALGKGAAASSNLGASAVLGEIYFTDNAGNPFAVITGSADAATGANDYPGRLTFSTTADGASSPTERMRITNGGVINTLSADAINTLALSTTQSAGTSTTLIYGAHTGTGGVGSGTQCFKVYSNGNVQNTNNSYTAISDIKLKENIVDAGSQWDDIKALQVRNYNLKEGQTHRQIGLIAQEVEPISPGLVYESPDRDEEGNDLGTVTKSVNYSVLYMKAVKALQEAMERIEQLEQRLTDAGIA